MKNIFELEEGKIYKVYKNGRELHREFRVKNNKLENNGSGRFSPCDWVPLNGTTKFSESYNQKEKTDPLFFLNIIKNIFKKNKKYLSLLELEEGCIYKSSSIFLPKKIKRVKDNLIDVENNKLIQLQSLSLKTKFYPISNPLAKDLKPINQIKEIIITKEKEEV